MLVAKSGLTKGQLQDWFYRRRMKDIAKTFQAAGGDAEAAMATAAAALVEASEPAVPTVDHVKVAPPSEPATLDEAMQYINRAVVKYFEPVPELDYPGGNAAGIVYDVQLSAPPSMDGPPRYPLFADDILDDVQFLFLVRFGDTYEEYLLWSNLAPILLPQQPEGSGVGGPFSHFSEGMAHGRASEGGVAALGLLAARKCSLVKRHRPLRYIQLPVGRAHKLFGQSTAFPYSLRARMFVDGTLVLEVDQASIVRCKHTRTIGGFQYQLYGVQDFRRAHQDSPLKVVSMTMAKGGVRSIDVKCINVVDEGGAWRARAGTVPLLHRYRAPTIPAAFMSKHFANAVFPLTTKVLVELNGMLQGEEHSCTIHHDDKGKVYRIKDDSTMYAAYHDFEFVIDSWKKLGPDTLQMVCRGGRAPAEAVAVGSGAAGAGAGAGASAPQLSGWAGADAGVFGAAVAGSGGSGGGNSSAGGSLFGAAATAAAAGGGGAGGSLFGAAAAAAEAGGSSGAGGSLFGVCGASDAAAAAGGGGAGGSLFGAAAAVVAGGGGAGGSLFGAAAAAAAAAAAGGSSGASASLFGAAAAPAAAGGGSAGGSLFGAAAAAAAVGGSGDASGGSGNVPHALPRKRGRPPKPRPAADPGLAGVASRGPRRRGRPPKPRPAPDPGLVGAGGAAGSAGGGQFPQLPQAAAWGVAAGGASRQGGAGAAGAAGGAGGPPGGAFGQGGQLPPGIAGMQALVTCLTAMYREQPTRLSALLASPDLLAGLVAAATNLSITHSHTSGVAVAVQAAAQAAAAAAAGVAVAAQAQRAVAAAMAQRQGLAPASGPAAGAAAAAQGTGVTPEVSPGWLI
ncbi:hypothetical protein FOA52_001460 [Chlamydomonas sp. UWO 241]|nr:hypothetical protein FOA52_001460 [Chlamydomonas sp. UWO 241]